MTVASLERVCGFSNGSISKWDKHVPSKYKIQAVADALGTTVHFLVDGETGIKKESSIPKDEELKNDAMWEKREEISRMLPDLTSQQLSDIINYIENTNNPELNARYSELLKIASMMSSEKYQTVMALLKELL